MSKMVSMARKTEPKETDVPCCEETSKYPYGLVISLENGHIKELGLDPMPGVGTEIILSCKAKVTSCRSEEMKDGGTENCISMQITAMQADLPKKSMFDHPSRVKE